MKKVCVISPAAFPLIADISDRGVSGGAEIQLVTLGFLFLEKGFSVSFIVNESKPPMVEDIKGVRVFKSQLKHFGMSNLHLPFDILRFMRNLVKVDADVYLIKLPRHMLLPLGLYSKIFRKKIIFIGQVDADADKSKLKKTDSRVASLMYNLGLKFIDAIAAQTDAQKKGFLQSFSGDVRVIRNILTMDVNPDSEKEDYVLWVGNSGVHKQPELFLELAKVLPDIKFKMIMSPSAQRPDDAFIRRKLDEVPNLEFIGPVPFSQMPEYFSKASLLVSTSYSEGFPNIFLQAWQFRTPTVSLNIDPDDVIQRFNLGLLSGSFEKLVEDVAMLHSDDSQRMEMGDNALQYTQQHHAKEVVIRQYLELFESLR
ncbi:MAG TPA: glycosyltransferase family 4 protein [Gammaproteobacteria bacterium]